MELVGKVVSKSIHDVAKGKGAESHVVGRIEIKLDDVEGLQGRCAVPVPLTELKDYELGDVVNMDLVFKQQKLGLAGGAR